MKATLFAVVLSILLIPFTTFAETKSSLPAKVIQKNQLVNLNKADVSTLTQSFKGIGKKRAEAIVAYRETHGGFKSVEELGFVKGIGKSFVDKHLVKLKETYSV